MTLQERFYGKCIPEPNTGCWLWLGSVNKRGYGSFSADGRTHRAHRFSWQLHNGKSPGELFVRHKCDQPSCVNPEHLVIGTHADNMADMALRGRNPKRRLSTQDVADIRAYAAANPTLGHRAVAKRFGIGQEHTSDIIGMRKRVLS